MICQYKDTELLGIGTLWVSLDLGPQTFVLTVIPKSCVQVTSKGPHS